MARRPAFGDVLDELLTERVSGAAEALPGRRGGVATASLGGFAPYLSPNRFWTTPGPYVNAAPDGTQSSHHAPDVAPGVPAASFGAAEPLPRPTTCRAEPTTRRVHRLLKPAEDTALQTLVRLGASLDRTFTVRELRSAFRELAHRYHPDRHPHANDGERSKLGATFAELTSAYGVLLSSGQN